ncbi:SDR family oxidoreductase [Caulobacter sp. Root1472]|uniref:SDR family NAD(P)-dependent oxidoreductase n=2 Tax=Caulobacter TaxID=75 RepID=UPI0006F2B2A4|nr:SDR family NAD(P)-dependent oxidoreductase [Caulobacter sp. Root1472]KQZ32880.1 oxidoreductase [Caulobacter sp. Root1472]
MIEDLRPLAVVTGASSGIGYELARLAAEDGYDLVIAADAPSIVEAQASLEHYGTRVDALQVDLATTQGVDQLLGLIGARPVDALMANAGRGLGHGFLDQDWDDARRVLDTNVTGTIYLIHRVGRRMRDRERGRILITGSIAGLIPGSFQALYNASKAFLDSFSWALRNELKDTGVTVTCLMPGLTDTEFFERAGMLDTGFGADPKKADPADVAKIGYGAMLKGEGDVVTGFANKLQAAMAAVAPQSVLAEQHRKMAEPGSGER